TPINTEAKKSISNFKLRTKEIIGLKVTLRGHRKEFFLNKLIHLYSYATLQVFVMAQFPKY
ncbi:MAG: hypothetical protein Q8830_02860, partial [Candidatus Phytoplasma australasiaticum]|nr:hypothetical protein [Candidatus Phytoplasma australasiaticum]